MNLLWGLGVKRDGPWMLMEFKVMSVALSSVFVRDVAIKYIFESPIAGNFQKPDTVFNQAELSD